MKQEWEVQRIKQLFRDVREADEQAAPSFEGIVAANGVRRINESIRPGYFLRLAVAALMIIVLFGAAFVFLRQGSKLMVDRETKAIVPSADPSVLSGGAIETPKTVIVPIKRRVRRRSKQGAQLISQWRSPTDFLMKTPGDELLRTIPRLDGALFETKGYANE